MFQLWHQWALLATGWSMQLLMLGVQAGVQWRDLANIVGFPKWGEVLTEITRSQRAITLRISLWPCTRKCAQRAEFILYEKRGNWKVIVYLNIKKIVFSPLPFFILCFIPILPNLSNPLLKVRPVASTPFTYEGRSLIKVS